MMPKATAAGEQQAWVGAVRAIVLTLAALLAAALLLRAALGFGPAYPAAVFAVALIGAFAILRYLPGRHPHPHFGPANAVTLARAALTALVAGLAVEPGTMATAWFAVAAGTLAAVLDGVDGRLARRYRVASEFGARFDMETDALLVLALAVLAWRWDRAGVWVLASGLMRYAFVAAGALLPTLRRPLSPSLRRQTVCVLQIVVLLVVVAPLLPVAVTAPLAATGVALLAWSFGIDLWRLAHDERAPLARELQ